MGKVKYSKKSSPVSSALRLKKSVCVILPRVDVTEFLRERRRRSLSLSQGGSPSSGSSPSVVPATSVRIKRKSRVKKEPPCLFHSQVDIIDNEVTEEIPAALDTSVQSDTVCAHDVTKSMCYMCSPHPTDDYKQEVWREINWHVPTPFVSNTSSAQDIEPTTSSYSVGLMNTSASERRTAEIGVGTENDLISVVGSKEQGTQTMRFFTCKQCLAMFTDVAHLIHHKAVHQKMFECPFCTANFISKNDLKSHLKFHMLPKYYDCVYCTQAFTKKHDIREHLALHAEQKQFRCERCPARFQHRTNLRNHEESHNVSKFIHVFKKIDDSEPLEKSKNSSNSPAKGGRRSAGSNSNLEMNGTSASTSVESTLKSKSPRCSTGSRSNPGVTTKRIFTSARSRIPTTLTPASPLVRPMSYLALASITDTQRPSNTSTASVSSGPSTSGLISVSTNTNTVDTSPKNGSGEVQISNPNFFQCPFCPHSSKHYRTFKSHSICHIRKNGKFRCTACGGKFMKKSGLILHTRHSHTLA